MSQPFAIILAAGFGSRLAPMTDTQPKGLITLDGASLLDHSVARLNAAGVARVRIVAGYRGADIARVFADNRGVEVVQTPYFETTGSLNSLLFGLESLPPDISSILVLESDLVYEARAIPRLTAGGTKILTSGFTKAGDEVYVWAQDTEQGPRQLTGLSKDPGQFATPSLGELTGLNAIDAADLSHVRAQFEQVDRQNPRADYEDGFVSAARITRVHCDLMEDLAWAEIDDHTMLSRVRNSVWPEIIRRDHANGFAR